MTPAALAAVKQASLKQANPAAPAPAVDANGAPTDAAVLSNIGKLMLAAGGLGMGARGLLGLRHNVRRATKPSELVSPNLVPLKLPLPGEKLGWTFGGVAEKGLNAVGNLAGQGAEWLKGPGPTSAAGKGWPIPVAALGGMGALYGGWKAMDSLLDSDRKSELEAEKLRAKQELQTALLDQFSNEPQLKTASEGSLGRDLDKLLDLVEKQAWNRSDALGVLGGTVGTAALLSALGTGMAAYKNTKSRSNEKLLSKATKLRQRRLEAMQPTPLLAVPQYETAAV